MKINQIKIQRYKFFKYHLLKLQIYLNKQNSNKFFNDSLQQIEISLKQILKLIFEYHICGFKILFVGLPIRSKKWQTKLLTFTNHNFISKNSWINGIFRNRLSIMTYLKLSQSQKFSENISNLLTIKTRPHLVVLFDGNSEEDVIQEFYKGAIPIISFNYNKLNINKISYKTSVELNVKKKNLNSLYFFLIYSLLKKKPFYKRQKKKPFGKKKYRKNRKVPFHFFKKKKSFKKLCNANLKLKK